MTEQFTTVSGTPILEGESARGAPTRPPPAAPRIGFVGAGWIGRNRLEAISNSGAGQVAAVADPAGEVLEALRPAFPDTAFVPSLEELLALPLDGVVIATPSALHAEHAIAALDRGIPVFCQKPLGRTAAETAKVVAAAERADVLLGVDLSYRWAAAFARIREIVRAGEIGRVYAADLVFHNAYGPDKPWFYEPRFAGGGCVIDLGIHLVDMALWVLGFPVVDQTTSRLYARGEPLGSRDVVEDFATAQLDLRGGTTVRVACSWKLPAGQDAVISAVFYGSRGAVAARNVDGSFYDFVAERYDGTQRQLLVQPPDAWGGRAAVAWARRLAHDRRFDPSSREFVRVAEIVDRIYGREP